MADLVYIQARFNELLGRINSNINKLESELETFNRNYETVKRNWSGTEFEKAEPKFTEMRETLERALADSRQQKKFLEEKNNDFANARAGF